MTRNVGIYIFDEVEVLDLGGPFEVFSTASRMKLRLAPDTAKPFEVFTVADTLRPVRARGGLTIQPAFELTDHPAIDVLIVPGGEVGAELKREVLIAWIARTSAKASLTASVCTGAFLLAKAGLLAGKTVTTHWEDVADLRAMFPDLTVVDDRRWVDAGDVVTSAGISAGIDMSLQLVARLEGEELAVRTARQMDYDWRRLP
ncbi:MAG TPA: thiamine biosynthesis protein ThiJ [Verrucomicrobiales bacterium]|nr:thiamine biosynthesis protein ThiJ [Verrucomicrobiales bacterium]